MMKPLSQYQETAVNKFLALSPLNTSAILEVGSDVDYAVVDYIASKFSGKVVGINPTPGFVRRSRDEGPPNVTIMEEDGCNQPFEDGAFDAILSIATLEHVLELPKFLSECYRVLRPGGIFYATFGPIYSSGIGHHVCAFAGRKEARFWKPERNPLPDFSHLLFDENQMKEYLLDSPYDDRLIEPIIEWVYHSSHINRLYFEDYVKAFRENPLHVLDFRPGFYKNPPDDIQRQLEELHGAGREFCFNSIEVLCVKEQESFAGKNNFDITVPHNLPQKSPARPTPHTAYVVLNFHRKDQHSAAALLNLLMTVPEGVTCKYYLQYGDDESSLEIKDVLTKFMQSKSAEFSNKLPDIRVPDEFISHDPNLLSYDGNHALRSPEQKRAIYQWNLCVFKYIQLLDDFLVIEPDCVILKENWLKEIFTEYRKFDYPVFGHLKKGMIGNSPVPTHWAGCSVYNGKKLRELPLAHHFFNRYDNPWWPYRNAPGTTNANNAFYGPVFSGYDVSYDYFLFALYWKETTGSNNPADWPLNTLVDRSDLIFCDFHSPLSADEIMSRHAGKLPLMHGVKHDEIRHRMRHYFAQGDTQATDLTADGIQVSGYTPPPGQGLSEEDILAISNRKLAAYRDRHRGQRCVIIGNGPSLNKMDLSFLEHEITFGMNRIYFLFDKWKFRPTYYASVNPLVLEQSADEILKIAAPKFLSNKGIPFFPYPPDDVMFIKSLPKWYFSRDPREGLCEGWTVTFFAMQLAYFMGFSEVILIGVDHHFVTQGDPNKEVVSEGADPNHFHPDYFGKGIRWHLPDLERSEGSYRMAKQAFEAEGRRIIDATVEGKLTIFPKTDYRELFLDPKATLMRKLAEMMNEYAANPTPDLGFRLASRLRMANLHEEADMVTQHIHMLLQRR